MRLPGRLRTTTLGDIFGLLYRERATGTLELIEETGFTAGRRHRIDFEGGLLARVESTLPCHPIGEILRREGVIDEPTLRRVASRCWQAPGKRIGELFLEERVVSAPVLMSALRYQLRLRVDALFTLPDARLCFHVPRPRPPEAPGQIPLSAREFLHGRQRARGGVSGSPRRAAPAEGRCVESARPWDPARCRALSALGLDGSPDADTVRRAFRRLAAEHHPDRFPHASADERSFRMRRFAELSAAYHALL